MNHLSRVIFHFDLFLDELQVTHNGHTSRGKPTVDELLSREFRKFVLQMTL